MREVFLFGVLGLGAGAVYAMLGLGLVVAYQGSGVVNFAQGAIAMFAAYEYVDLTEHGMGKYAAFSVTLALFAVGGALLYAVVFRPLRSAPVLARLVASLGVLLVLQSAVQVIYGSGSGLVPPILTQDSVELFGTTFGEDRLWLLGITVVLAVALWALYRFTAFGRATKASAENEKGAILVGYSPDVIGAANWMLACVVAALAGILFAPITSLNSLVFTLLIIPALASALIGRFSSFALTATAGILLGVAQSEVQRYYPDLKGHLSFLPGQGAKEVIPFLVIIVVMVVAGQAIPARGSLTAGRPPFATDARLRLVPAAIGIVAVVAALLLFDRSLQSATVVSMTYAIVGLSVVVVTGYAGQISLAQMSFAGVGAFCVARFAGDLGVPFPIPILIGAVVAVPVGVLLGLPALRVRGVNLAVITIAAAVALDNVLFQNPDYTGGFDGLPVPEPRLFGVSLNSFTHPERYGIFVLAVLLGCCLLVGNVRRSRTGRSMLAVRDNERAASAGGVNVAATKLRAFAFSAFVAALAGGVGAYQLGQLSPRRFGPLESIFLVAIVYIGGVGSVGGALIAGSLASGGLVFTLADRAGGSSAEYQGMVLGALLVAITIFAPDGLAVASGRVVRALRRRRRGSRPGEAGLAPRDGLEPEPLEAAVP